MWFKTVRLYLTNKRVFNGNNSADAFPRIIYLQRKKVCFKSGMGLAVRQFRNTAIQTKYTCVAALRVIGRSFKSQWNISTSYLKMNSKEFWDTNYCGRQLIFRWYFIFEGKVMTVTTFDDDDPKCPELLNRFLHHFTKSKCLAKNQNMILFWKEKNGTSKAMCFQWRDLCFQIDSKEYISGSYLGFLPKSDKQTPFGGKSL